VSVLVWAMMGIALWHAAVLVPDRFVGGIVGAFVAGLAGALVTGFALPRPASRPPTRPGWARRSGRCPAGSARSSPAT
jgi:uncharacterized membrane protein YeaQ/YmgE (transglycosylase-associated protein family)